MTRSYSRQLTPPTSAASLSLPTCNSHRPASAANASGFLLTPLSNARPNTPSSAFCRVRASDKAVTSPRSNPDDLSSPTWQPKERGELALCVDVGQCRRETLALCD